MTFPDVQDWINEEEAKYKINMKPKQDKNKYWKGTIELTVKTPMTQDEVETLVMNALKYKTHSGRVDLR